MRRLFVLVVTAAALLGSTAIASAATTRYSDFTTAGRGNAGYATGVLAVTWNSASSATVGVSLSDVCPQNGYGVYMHLRLRTSSGDWYAGGTAYNSNGCGTTSSGSVWWPTSYGRLSHIDGKMCEEDHNGSLPDICTDWHEIDNPYT
jgi:hypothetical protein